MATHRIPNVAHFVFGLRPQDEPFHLVHHLAIASCRAVVRPDEIVVHCGELPYGRYWDLIRPWVTLRRVEPVAEIAAHEYADPWVARYSYAHHADQIRLDVLLEHGGLYADIDTLFVRRPAPALWDRPCVIGRERDVVDPRSGQSRPSLSNALVLAEPGSAFIRRWREQLLDAFDGSWSAHSCFLADDLARAHPDEVHVEPERTFHGYAPTPDDLRRLLVGHEVDLDGITSIHLAAHLWWEEARRDFVPEVHARTIDEAWVRAGRTTYAAAAAPFLPQPAGR
jgi:hypothetical protein